MTSGGWLYILKCADGSYYTGTTRATLEQRLAEVRSMRLEIQALEAQPDGTSAVRGAGVCGRTGYQAGPLPVTISRKPPRS